MTQEHVLFAKHLRFLKWLSTVLDMKRRADQAIKDNELGGEGWAQLLQRVNKAFPEKAKQFLRDKFQMGEESSSEKVSL